MEGEIIQERIQSVVEKHFREKEVVNFDIIHKFIRGEKTSEADLKNYQTVKYERVKRYPQEDKNDFLGAAFRSDRKDLYFDKEVIKSHFLDGKEKFSGSNRGNGSQISGSS